MTELQKRVLFDWLKNQFTIIHKSQSTPPHPIGRKSISGHLPSVTMT